MQTLKLTNELETGICTRCGITANILTCLKKYGVPPLKFCYDISTYCLGICEICGDKTSITEARDYFHPDFSLIKKVVRFLQKEKEQNNNMNIYGKE